MKSAVIYARYSSERQSEQSIEGQLCVCNEFAQRNGLRIVGTYIDRAMTGTNDHRAEFQRMLSDSDTPQEWEIVLVYALDRFGRNSVEIAINKQRLHKNGKILISATQRTSQNIDGSQNLDGIILENVMIGIAEYYSAELSQKIKRGQNESREKGNFVGGGIANTFMAAAGHKVGKSLCEEDLIPTAKELAEKTHIPEFVDVVVGKEFSETTPAVTKDLADVADDDMIFDLGPKSMANIEEVIKNAKTILWNGPVGVFEFDQFAEGSKALANAIADSAAFSVAGGGDTIAAIQKFGVTSKISYISTGGGAFLEFVEGKKLPAVEILEKRAAE